MSASAESVELKKRPLYGFRELVAIPNYKLEFASIQD